MIVLKYGGLIFLLLAFVIVCCYATYEAVLDIMDFIKDRRR